MVKIARSRRLMPVCVAYRLGAGAFNRAAVAVEVLLIATALPRALGSRCHPRTHPPIYVYRDVRSFLSTLAMRRYRLTRFQTDC